MDLNFWMSIFLGLLVVLLCLLLHHLNKRHGYIEDLGVPVIPSKYFLGTPPFDFHKVTFHQMDMEWFQKLNTKTYGRYDGTIPTIVTKDPDLLKPIFVKHFDNFRARDNFTFPDDYLTLDIASGESWKSLRKGMSPTFTSGKIKHMVNPITDMADRLITHIRYQIKNPDGSVVDVRPLLQGYTFDIIGRCAYGADFNIVQPDRVEVPMIMKATKQSVIDDNIVDNWVMAAFWNVIFNFPIVLKMIPTFSEEMYQYVKKLTKAVMDKRNREDAPDSGDFMDRLRAMSASITASGKYKHEGMTQEMVLAQGVIFLAAGYETTATTMAILLYNLSKNPDIQDKCFKEVKDLLEKNDRIDHDTVLEMSYLEACILENLRLYPPVTRNNRLCGKTTQIGAITIKAGTTIMVPTYAMQRDKDLFGHDADVYNPDRFHGKHGEELSKSIVFHSFGYGPRICIGMRFAMIEMKITVAKLLNEFEILEEPGVTDLKFKPGSPFLLRFDETKVKFKRR